MEEILKKWLEIYFGDDPDFDGIKNYELFYHIDDRRYFARIDLNTAIDLSLDRRKNIMLIANDYYHADFDDFITAARGDGYLCTQDIKQYLTSENYSNIRKQLEEIFSEIGFENNELYFACEFMMLTLKKPVYTFADFETGLKSTLKEIFDRNNMVYDYHIENRIWDCYLQNHEEYDVGESKIKARNERGDKKLDKPVSYADVFRVFEGMEDFWGNKVRKMHTNSEKTSITCMLYNSFQLTCDVDSEGTFHPSLKWKETDEIIELFGEAPLIKNNEVSIKEFCQMVDDYCRQHLSDEFLDAYEKAYASW